MNAPLPAPLAAEDIDRIDRMVAEFNRIGDEHMRELALYNNKLSVEAIGFRRWEGWLGGVVVTPWFMNLILLPLADQLDGAAAGTKQRIQLPCGEQLLTIGEIDGTGTYAAYSLHSPMGEFGDQLNAAARAWVLVDKFFQPPPEQG